MRLVNIRLAALSKLPYLEDGRERVGGRVGTDRQTRVSSKARPSLATLQLPTPTTNYQPQSVDINAVVEAKVNFSVLR